MHYSSRKERADLLPIVWVLAAICLLLALLLGYSLWKQSAAMEAPPVLDETTPTEPVLSGTQPQNVPMSGANGWLEIETPYGVLRYPDRWQAYLRVYPSADMGYSVLFSCRLSAGVELPMFDISFDQVKGNFVGYLAEEDGKTVPVYLQTYSLGLEDALGDGDWDTYLAMQEDLNQVLEQIRFAEQAPVETEDVVIETPYGTLVYPGEYAPYLQTQHKDNSQEYTVEVFCVLGLEDVRKLFTVICNDDPEGAVGTMNESGKMVHISMEEPALEGLSQDKQDLILAMMEAVNDLLDALDR